MEKDRHLHTPDSNKFHVTELVFNCPRQIFLRRVVGDFFISYPSIFRLAIGRKMHEISILKEHEKRIEWQGIVGTVDEYENGVLIEKKTTVHAPRNAPYGHHVTQAEYYKVLLEETGNPVLHGFILYFDVSNVDDPLTIFEVPFRLYDVIKSEMIRKRNELLKIFGSLNFEQKFVIPARKTSWLCKYCDYAYMCYMPIDKLQKIVDSARKAKMGTILFDL